MSDWAFRNTFFLVKHPPKWGTYSTVWLLHGWYHLKLPPALLAEWLRSFTCYCGNMVVEWILKEGPAQNVDPGEENSPAQTWTQDLLITRPALYHFPTSKITHQVHFPVFFGDGRFMANRITRDWRRKWLTFWDQHHSPSSWPAHWHQSSMTGPWMTVSQPFSCTKQQ